MFFNRKFLGNDNSHNLFKEQEPQCNVVKSSATTDGKVGDHIISNDGTFFTDLIETSQDTKMNTSAAVIQFDGTIINIAPMTNIIKYGIENNVMPQNNENHIIENHDIYGNTDEPIGIRI